MKLAVIMATHNNAKRLPLAIKSILNQSFKQFKFIIVDDASIDETSQILRKIKDKRVKLITNQKHLGLTKSLNKALKQTKARYIARMDADDFSLPQRFKTQLDFLDKHPKIALLGTAAILINHQGKKIGTKHHPSDSTKLRQKILQYCPFIHPTWMIRRSVLIKVGSYNPDFEYSQDYELALRIMAKYQTANLNQALIKYRVNTTSAISIANLKKQEWLAIKARFLALTKYHYPKTESWKLVKPLISFLIPASIKLLIYRKTFFKES